MFSFFWRSFWGLWRRNKRCKNFVPGQYTHLQVYPLRPECQAQCFTVQFHALGPFISHLMRQTTFGDYKIRKSSPSRPELIPAVLFNTIGLSFYPLAFQAERVLSLPVPVRLSVHKLYLVCTMTPHRFELESPNLYQIRIVGYSRLVSRIGVINHELQSNLAIFK